MEPSDPVLGGRLTAEPVASPEGSRWKISGPLELSDDASEAWLDGRTLVLTHAQRLVLRVLMARQGRIARREDLYIEAFDRALPTGSRAIDTHITRLRRAFGEKGACIVTVGRVGYRLDLATLGVGASTPSDA